MLNADYWPSVRKAFNVILAMSLVHFFPPKHHARALRIIDDVLAEDPDNVTALLCRGFVLQHAKRWSDAAELFGKVIRINPDDYDKVSRAKEEHAWCKAQDGELQVAAGELRGVIDALDDVDGRDEDKARCWWKLGRCYWDMGGKLLQVDRVLSHDSLIGLQSTKGKKHTSTLSPPSSDSQISRLHSLR